MHDKRSKSNGAGLHIPSSYASLQNAFQRSGWESDYQFRER
jgi:hypothetical protein